MFTLPTYCFLAIMPAVFYLSLILLWDLKLAAIGVGVCLFYLAIEYGLATVISKAIFKRSAPIKYLFAVVGVVLAISLLPVYWEERFFSSRPPLHYNLVTLYFSFMRQLF